MVETRRKTKRSGPLPRRDAVRRVMVLYPRIFFACHTRHVADPETRKILSAHQASILDHLDETEPTTLSGLAAHMGVTPSTMSIAVGRLVGGGYVRRTRDPRDGRRVDLRLTAAGVRIKEAKTVLDPERVRAMLEHLSPEDRARAVDGLALLAGAAEAEQHTSKGERHVEMDPDRPGRRDRSGGADGADRNDDPKGPHGE